MTAQGTELSDLTLLIIVISHQYGVPLSGASLIILQIVPQPPQPQCLQEWRKPEDKPHSKMQILSWAI